MLVPGSFSGSVVGSAISGRSTPESLIGLTITAASTSSAPGLSAVVTFALSSVSSVVMVFLVVIVGIDLSVQLREGSFFLACTEGYTCGVAFFTRAGI